MEDDPDPDDESHLSEEQQEAKKDFRKRRQQHYNEFQAVRLARQLMADEDEED